MKVSRRKFNYCRKECPKFRLHKVNDNKYIYIQSPLGVLKYLIATSGCLVNILLIPLKTMLCGLWEGITLLPNYCRYDLLDNLKKISPVFVFEIEDEEDISI